MSSAKIVDTLFTQNFSKISTKIQQFSFKNLNCKILGKLGTFGSVVNMFIPTTNMSTPRKPAYFTPGNLRSQGINSHGSDLVLL